MSSTPPTWCSVDSPARPRSCCAASTSPYAPHLDVGDFVVIVNAGKVALTGSKRDDKVAYRHSGHPGGLKTINVGDQLRTHPDRVVERAIKGMLPHNTLGRQMLKLKVYAGPEHPHAAQQPQPFEIKQVAQ